jgi:error-prone DNA polymerase
MLIGYLLGLSHIDPLEYNLSLERFLPEDALHKVPDIDLDFPRNIREELIRRVHQKYGWDHAALTGMIDTYLLKGAIRDLGKALSLPRDEVDRLAKSVEHGGRDLREEMETHPGFKDKVGAPGWRHLVELSRELVGFPKYLAQHPGGMIISSSPLTELVPVQPGAIDGRYICQWDKDAIEDAGFVKIDFLALGTLSQMQDALHEIEQRHGRRVDLSRIDFDDRAVYGLIHRADTIGVFQVESGAQMQTVTRIRPTNLVDMAHEVGAVRPGVGVNDGVRIYIRRRQGFEPVAYDHPLERRALERTLGVILFQDQVNQLAIDVAGMAPSEADQLRRAFKRNMRRDLLEHWWKRFRDGARAKGVSEKTALKIFRKFNGEYMFPESHAFSFGVTAYQSAWLKLYYPVEFYWGLFNQQPMGFYSLETLKEDARRHNVKILNPDANRSHEKCTIECNAIRLGFLNVLSVGEVSARAIVQARGRGGAFSSVGDFMQRAGLLREELENLADAGVLDSFNPDRRAVRWEIGLRYTPGASGHRQNGTRQMAMPLPVQQDVADLPQLTTWEKMFGEYRTMGLHPAGHIMATLRASLPRDVLTSGDVAVKEDGVEVMVAGLVVRRQRPLSKAVFITLEDEFGHIPCMAFPDVYEKYRLALGAPLVVVQGTVSRCEGTMNVMITSAEALQTVEVAPRSKDWG